MFTGMPHVSTDAGQKTLTVRGTAGQIAMAAWLVGELDVAAGSAQQSKDPSRLEYRVQNGGDDLVRVFNLKHIKDSKDLQKTRMLLKVTTGIPKLFNYGRRPTLVAGGTSEQIRAAEWLLAELDQPAGRQRDNLQARFSASYPAPGAPQELVRVFCAADNTTVRELDEISITFRANSGYYSNVCAIQPQGLGAARDSRPACSRRMAVHRTGVGRQGAGPCSRERIACFKGVLGSGTCRQARGIGARLPFRAQRHGPQHSGGRPLCPNCWTYIHRFPLYRPACGGRARKRPRGCASGSAHQGAELRAGKRRAVIPFRAGSVGVNLKAFRTSAESPPDLE